MVPHLIKHLLCGDIMLGAFDLSLNLFLLLSSTDFIDEATS